VRLGRKRARIVKEKRTGKRGLGERGREAKEEKKKKENRGK
jgi:hypothetical protein